jgi:hypothetical protein
LRISGSSATFCSGAQGIDEGVKEVDQDLQDIIVEVKLPIARPVAGTTDVVEVVKQLGEPPKVLDAADVLDVDVPLLCCWHAGHDARWIAERKRKNMIIIEDASNPSAERDWECPP